MFDILDRARIARVASCSLAALIAAGAVSAAPAAIAATSGPAPDAPELESVVVTAPTGSAASIAPSKASLSATEPQSLVTRTFIEDSVADTSDYTGIAVITPSASGVASNGPGLSEKDATIRGFGDGEYNVTYDGIPFGDTNDPTHHSTAYFPASTIGALQIDRGPGEAGDLGQATFGGSMNLFSRSLSDRPYAQQKVTVGSWNTFNFVTTLQSGAIRQLHDTKITANFQELMSDGALSYAHVKEYNQFFKVETPLTSHLTVTFLATHNSGSLNQPDNDGVTLAQAQKYGKNFSMSNDPSAPTYYKYNTVNKQTDFEYLRLHGDVGHGFGFDDTVYTYGYTNDTLSATDTTQSLDDMLAGTYPGWGTKAAPKGNHDVKGYDKLNAYRVWGNIARVSQTFAYGQIRAGVWYEGSDTTRHRFDLDRTLGVFDPAEKPPKTGPVPPAYIQYLEYSSWTQYQPFLDLELHPVAGLTVTPGVKYLNFTRKVDAPVEAKTRLADFTSQQTFTHTSPYLTVNYRIGEHAAVYAQYAQGFLVPPLKIFYVPKPGAHPGLQPQESTNYQIGAVYNANRFTVDADVYYIEFKHKIAKAGGTTGDPYYTNLPGTVIYKGVEGEGTFDVGHGLAVFANGSVNSAKDSSGKQIAEAPEWTAAAGLIYKAHGFNVSLIDKFTGRLWAIDGEDPNYKINAYSTTNLIVGYDFGRIKVEGGIYNLFGNRNITDIAQNDGPAPITTSHDQYWFQPDRSFQLTLRASY